MAYIYDLTDTWNAGATTFNGIKMNVTDTASSASSKLVTLQVSGTEHFSVTKGGVGYLSNGLRVRTTTDFGTLSVYGTSGFNADGNASIAGSGSHKFRGSAGATTITTYDYLNYTAIQFIRDNGNPTNTVGSITCTDTATSYNTSSDRRLKKDIVPASDSGSVIDRIEVVSHGWLSNENIVPFGVIAQDLNEVAPQAVYVGDDGEEIEQVWSVDYSKLVPMLLKEIQSLRARVANLEL
ncbi:MAG TPA: tail fiber domain-containing protein [Pseudomonadales bacterium]|nr:tail fiber domain-containing protein [Pseudomonadales bacterium]